MGINEVILISIFVLAIGACIGSFLNVAALRAISKESIVFPASKCPLCGEHIKWYDNIPVFSYFFTIKGKCRNCGEKVSIQYPLVESLTALIFFAVFFSFGFTLKTLLILILLCISIVITITDFKKNEIFDVHNWLLIVMAIITGLYFKGLENNSEVAIGLITGAILMEAVARLSYYLVKKKSSNNSEDSAVKEEEETQEQNSEEEDIDINDYIEKNKRAFGEGDTYLAAASGALLGWQGLILAIAIAIVLQALCILPQFIIALYKQKHYRLLISLSAFIVLSIIYWVLSNIFTLHLFVVFAIVIPLIYCAIDTITELKKTVNNEGFKAIPFGPALLLSTFLILFFGSYIIKFLIEFILV